MARSHILQKEWKNVLFAHHPCPDGITALVCLQEKFGSNASYVGFNHAKPDDMRHIIYSIIGDKSVNIIFADITPPVSILKELFENTNCTITILDHHETAIKELETHKAYLNNFSNRLHMILDVERSGASIAYDYVHDNDRQKYPAYVSLVQTMDRFTATSDLAVLQAFDAKSIDFDSESKQLMSYLASLTPNKQIKDNIEFYVLASILDKQLKQFFMKSHFKVDPILIASTKQYFDDIEKFGFASLLNDQNLKAEFTAQLNYQTDAIDNAVVVTSGISDAFDVLFVEANLQTGRTFDALIEAKLKSLPHPTIALISDTKNITENNWVSLRSAENQFNLSQIAFEYKNAGIAINAGGHARASAMQLCKDQLLIFKNQSDSIKQMRSTALGKLSMIGDKSSIKDEHRQTLKEFKM